MLDIYRLTNFYSEIVIKFTVYFNKELYFKIDKFSNIEYAYIKGLSLLKNVFNINLLYLDDLNELSNTLEKIYIYYVEFLNQIYFSKIMDNFELSIKDAVIFCYRKNIINYKIKENNIKLGNDFNKFNLLLDIVNISIITINCNYEYIMLNDSKKIINNFEIKSLEDTNSFFYEKIIFINRTIKKIMQLLFINKSDNKTVNNTILENVYSFFNNLYYSIEYHDINKLSKSDKEEYYNNLYKVINNYLSKNNFKTL